MSNEHLNEIKKFLQDNIKKEENDINNNEFKIICFICSNEFPSVDIWKHHIIEDHKQNEEYLLCPECGIPCRDLKCHYKVHHKNIEMPNLPILKVDKFYDWDQKYTRLKKKKTKWKEGFFDSTKMGKKIHYRSSWERDVMICLEKCEDIVEYHGDNYLCIPYYILSKKYRYWPDFTIKLNTGETFIVEIKPLNQTEWTINKKKWKAASEFCYQRSWHFQVWTQKHIRKIKTRAVRKENLLSEDIIPFDEGDIMGEI